MKKIYIDKAIISLLVFSLLLIGMSIVLGSNASNVSALFEFYQLTSVVSQKVQGILAGAGFLITAILVAGSYKQTKLRAVAFIALILLALIPLITLISEKPWVSNLGGFPIIGSGQGIIKYTALIGVALYLFKENKFSMQTMVRINLIPIILILVWIGVMKFYEFEAKAIEPLVSSSPFMSWLYSFFSLQIASNIIGTYDLFIAFSLFLAVLTKHRLATLISAFGCLAVFIATQTFLFSAPGAYANNTILTRLGVFIIKDLWLIANVLIVIYGTNYQKEEGY